MKQEEICGKKEIHTYAVNLINYKSTNTADFAQKCD